MITTAEQKRKIRLVCMQTNMSENQAVRLFPLIGRNIGNLVALTEYLNNSHIAFVPNSRESIRRIMNGPPPQSKWFKFNWSLFWFKLQRL